MFLFNLYQILRAAPLSEHGRYRTFETAAVDSLPWHIDCISVKALEQLVSKPSTAAVVMPFVL